jgi:hypothetical protein
MDAALNPKALAQLRHGDDLPAPAEAAEDPPPKAREST